MKELIFQFSAQPEPMPALSRKGGRNPSEPEIGSAQMNLQGERTE
jgi:hypothetical protein